MRIIKKLLWLSFVAFILGVVFLVLVFFYFSKDLPSFDQIRNRQVQESTKIYDRSGETLLYEISNGQKRTTVPLVEIPQHLKDATIALEDANFYNEPGFSLRGIFRAFFVNLTQRKIVQGGSSITQQLAKNAFLTPEQTIPRKIKELILAVKLTQYYSKDEIIELYLNEIPYGPTIYGVEAASQSYFAKPVSELTLSQSAILAALPQAPSYYSPWGTHQKELLERQKLVLRRMYEERMISQEELERAQDAKISFTLRGEGIQAPHFVIAVQDYLVQKYGEDLIRVGGLKVTTTLDWKLQELAEDAVENGAKRNEELYQGKNAALVAQDPKTGQILAMVGSRNYSDIENEGNFNVATQGLRQPGSALKPFIYMTAFEKGYTPDTVVFDVLTEFDTTGAPEMIYQPVNFDEQFRGPVSFRRALSQSINIPAVKVLYLVGLSDALETAQKVGLTTLNDPRRYGLSLVLGGGEIKLIDMVQAYSVLSQDGIAHSQTMILEIQDSKGNIIERFQNSSKKIIDSQYPRMVNDILTDVAARAGLYSASLHLTQVPGHDIALKTGTSNDYRDAWTFGYTPALVTGVWAGNNNNAPMQKKGSSILAALPIWDAFMEEALKNYKPEAFTRSEPVTAQKPILVGDYLSSNQIHNILYYVDRKNPTGPYPVNPEKDVQFKNWEEPVLEWARLNIPDFENYNQPGATSSFAGGFPIINLSRPEIEIRKPEVGEFIRDQVWIQAQITSQLDVNEINVFLNNQLVQKFRGNVGKNYFFSWQFNPQNLNHQNLLEIEAITNENTKTKAQVIIYK